MGAKVSYPAGETYGSVSQRGDVKSDSYRYLRTSTVDRTLSSSKERAYATGIAVLNHCFDDIEKFCARLQHTAAAAHELEQRRKYASGKRRTSHTKADDAILQLRASPPPESEFIDIFQKFKLAINLIAKLKYRLRDPDAFQLIQYLHVPLMLLISVSRDKFYSPSMANRAVSPLFTKDALSLMHECLSLQDLETWQSLGSAWISTREEWKGFLPPFYPIFYDGWAPDFPNIITSTPVAPIKRRKEITDSL